MKFSNETAGITDNELRFGGDIRFKNYRLENIYLRTTQTQRAEILAFWSNSGVLESGEAEFRGREAVFLVRAPSNELAGVSDVAVVRVAGRRRFYAFSLFLRKADRVPYLMITVLDATRDFLSDFTHPISQPEGLLIVTENPKLMRPGLRKILARHGYRYWGKNGRGEEVWVVEFGELDRLAGTLDVREAPSTTQSALNSDRAGGTLWIC
jgi:hypothetical protein